MVHQAGSVCLPKRAPEARPGRPGGHGRGTRGPRFRIRLLHVAALSALGALLAPGVAFALQDHVVAPGETLSGIALHYGVELDTLAAANGLADADHISVGQVLRVGGGGGAVAAALADGEGARGGQRGGQVGEAGGLGRGQVGHDLRV
ncbi:MAG: LysM peptidoglycan-binding domain-containing protein, partial [Gemmataceae bacterium]|nr:LysM peptidoglycan-binding domain-containing protein [Gemmataceae bacterium]